MERYERFTFLCDPNERQAIANLTERLSRPQSEAAQFIAATSPRFQKFTHSMTKIVFQETGGSYGSKTKAKTRI